MTSLLFNLCNTGVLFAWFLILFLPRIRISKALISFPWVPLFLSFFYLYFFTQTEGFMEADFTSLEGILLLFQQATLSSAAAGWLHYLAFDFWVGTWMIRHSQKFQIKHILIVLPLLCTFMLGPIGILIYSLVFFTKKKSNTIETLYQIVTI